MKNILFLILTTALIACSNNAKKTTRKFIEPCNYEVMSYQVKDTSYHKLVQKILNKKPYISIKGDSIFNITEELGKFLFNDSNFNYKIINDSLFISNNKNTYSYEILDLSANSFRIKIDHEYLNRIDLVKPKDMRRRIETKIDINY